MPMNLVWSAWSRSKLVSDITSDAMIGPAVNRARPISHGPRKTYPQIASRVDGRSVHRERRGRGVTGKAWDVSVIGGSGSCGRGWEWVASRAVGGSARDGGQATKGSKRST